MYVYTQLIVVVGEGKEWRAGKKMSLPNHQSAIWKNKQKRQNSSNIFLQKIDETFNVVLSIFAREKTAGECTNIENKQVNWPVFSLKRSLWSGLLQYRILNFGRTCVCTSSSVHPRRCWGKFLVNFVRVKKKSQNGRVRPLLSLFLRLLRRGDMN